MANPMPMRRRFAQIVSAVLCALPACSTQDIGPDDLRTHRTQTGPNQAALKIDVAPDPANVHCITTMSCYAPLPVNVRYNAFIDGRRLVYETLDLAPTTTLPGDARIGDLSSGPHHVEIADASDGAILFAGDAEMAAGTMTRLYLVGHNAAPEGLFVPYPFAPPAGSKHVNVTNLAIDSKQIEVVSCDDASHCTPISAPLDVGDTFDAIFPLTGDEDYDWSRNASGRGIGYRQLPTAAFPDPLVTGVYRDHGTTDASGPAVTFAAGVYLMEADGRVSLGTD